MDNLGTLHTPILVEDGEGNFTIEKGSERLTLSRQEMRNLRQIIMEATDIGLLDEKSVEVDE